MSTGTKPAVSLTIVLVKFDIDFEKAYELGMQIAKDFDAIFHGIHVFSLPNHELEDMTFTTDVDKINGIIRKVKEVLNIDETNMRYSIIPTVRPKSVQSMST